MHISREHDIHELQELGEALFESADATLVCEVRQRRDVQADVVDSENIDGSHLWRGGENKRERVTDVTSSRLLAEACFSGAFLGYASSVAPGSTTR